MSIGCGGKPAMNKHRMNKELLDFAARLRGLISASPSQFSEDRFSELALELFALQFKCNRAYQKICTARGATPEAAEHWTQIPAMPTAAFKELELSCISPEKRTSVFHSSGTTEQKPSRHFHSVESLAVYEASLWRWFEHSVLANSQFRIPNSKMLVLAPSPTEAPNSSLVNMFEIVRRKFGAPESAFVGQIDSDGSWVLDFDAVIDALAPGYQTPDAKPLLLLGTAFSFVHVLDFLAENNLRFNLPAGSRVMETGGYKNRSRSMPKSELHALITERLGVPAQNIVCEYGMSELSSQAYAAEARSFHFPPWARVQIISPESGREVANGETGLIRVFDLANVFSVAAIQTEDLGIRCGDGFELVGRAQLAEPRGCSLMTA
jgi:hypothetical protein